MVAESKISPLECWFSVILMFLLFLGKISCFPILIYLVCNFLYRDVLLKTYFLFHFPFPYTYAAEFTKKHLSTSSSGETKRENETMKQIPYAGTLHTFITAGN